MSWRGLREGLAPQRRLVAPPPPPEGIATVYAAVADVAALSTIVSPRTGSLVVTTSDGMQRVWSGSAWLVRAGRVANWLALGSIVGSVETGAIVGVGADLGAGVVRARWSGSAWERIATGVPATWTLSSLFDTDPSGLGLTLDGDAGIFNGLVYRRWTGARAGGGTYTSWLDSTVYAGTVVQRGWLLGTETLTAPTQGWTLPSLTGGGSRAPIAGGWQRLRTVNSGSAALECMVGTITSSTRFYARWECRADITGSASSLDTLALYYGDGSRGVRWYQSGTITVRSWLSGSLSIIGSTENYTGGGSAYPNTGTGGQLIEYFSTGQTGLDYVRIDGVLYGTARRFGAGAGSGTTNYWRWFVSTPNAVTMNYDMRNVELYNW